MSDTLKDDLTAAFEAAESAAKPDPEPAPPPEPVLEAAPPSPDEPSTAEVRARGPDGKFKPAEPKPAVEPVKAGEPAKPAVEPVKAAEPVKPGEAPKPEPVKPTVKAPQSWKPAAREAFLKAPPEVQQEALRVDKEVQQALRESAEARQGHQKYKETVAPFEQMIRAEGGEPLQAIQGLLQTAYALRMAPPQTKAQMLARMVQTFLPGREGLELLDAALTPGGAQPPAPPQYQQPTQPQQFRDPRVDQILAQRTQELTHRAEAQVAEVQGEEFYEDVRAEMADILELARKRGVDMTVRDAYNRAIRLNPEISRVLEQRDAAQRATQAATPRKAAVSVRSSPATPPNDGGEQSLRDIIAAQMSGT